MRVQDSCKLWKGTSRIEECRNCYENDNEHRCYDKHLILMFLDHELLRFALT